MIRFRQRRWLLPALTCAAMLILPTLAWLFFPRPSGFVLPPALPGAATQAALAPPAEPTSARPARMVRPAHTAAPAAAGPVSGVVLDPDGHPAVNAVVTCEDQGQTTNTDEEGRFQLPAEAAGCLAVARHPGFVSSERAPLAAGGSNTLRLSHGGGIEGEVVDEGGAPMASYFLGIESYQGPVSEGASIGMLKSIRDPRGVFALEKLVPGRYVLSASTEGRPPARSGPVDVEVGRTTAHVRITLARGATLIGHVFDAATRKPIAGAAVGFDALTATRAQPNHPATSNDQGAYSLDGAPAGPFSVRVTREGYRPRTVTGLTTRGASTLQQDIELNPIVDGGPTGEDFAGIGAFLASSPKGVTFLRFVSDGPAEKAGLHAGDLIRRIDGVDASGMSVNECMQSLRGPDGSRVSVQVEREGKRTDVTIQRRAITF